MFRLILPDMRGLKMAGVDLSSCCAPAKADLMNADFSGCIMHCVQLAGERDVCHHVKLLNPRPSFSSFAPSSSSSSDSFFADARLCGSNFTGADLTHAALPSNAEMMQGCMMKGSILRFSHLPVDAVAVFHPDLCGVAFSGLNLKGANFARLDISNCMFDKCILQDANFAECSAGYAV
jgi:uncharacterized protein YjbI with pentapeptide repeats